MSDLEDRFVEALLLQGVPEPVRELVFAKPRRWRFDLSWEDYKVACEVEGGTWVRGRHNRPQGFENDCHKYANAAIMGWMVIRVTSTMISDGSAAQYVIRALESRGYSTDAGDG